MPTALPWYLQHQPGVTATPGSDLYNQRVAANRAHGVPGGGLGGFMGGGFTGGGYGNDMVGPPETGLANNINTFMQGQALMPFLMNQPGFLENMGLAAGNVTSNLKGEIGSSTLAQIARGAAEFGIKIGSPGGPGFQTNLLATMGTTSEGLKAKGLEQFGELTEKITPRAEIWNPMSLYVPERLAARELAAAKEGETGRRAGDMGPDWWQRATGYHPIISRFTGPSGGML